MNTHTSLSVSLWIFLKVLQSCGSPELARSVISPHLSKDAVEFLQGHLTPKEMTIFELLGDGWTKPRYMVWLLAVSAFMCNVKATFWASFHSSSYYRADWPRDKCAPPYYPKFRNGWEPPAELFRTAPWETEGPTGPLGSPTSPDYRKHSAEEVRFIFIGCCP